MAVAAEMTTQTGTSMSFEGMWPLATRANVMMPIVFCASLVPWESAYRLPEASWPSRNPRFTGPGLRRPTSR
jgi:hypothetical protein